MSAYPIEDSDLQPVALGEADAPFGGNRQSGIGREGGHEMYHSYTVAKTIAERRVRV